MAYRIAAPPRRIEAGIDPADGGSDTLGNDSMRRQLQVQPCGSGGHALTVGIGGTDDLAGGPWPGTTRRLQRRPDCR